MLTLETWKLFRLLQSLISSRHGSFTTSLSSISIENAPPFYLGVWYVVLMIFSSATGSLLCSAFSLRLFSSSGVSNIPTVLLCPYDTPLDTSRFPHLTVYCLLLHLSCSLYFALSLPADDPYVNDLTMNLLTTHCNDLCFGHLLRLRYITEFTQNLHL